MFQVGKGNFDFYFKPILEEFFFTLWSQSPTKQTMFPLLDDFPNRRFVQTFSAWIDFQIVPWIQAPRWPNEEFCSLQSLYKVFFLEFYSVKCNKLMCQHLYREFDGTVLPPGEYFRNYSVIDFFQEAFLRLL